MPCDCIIRGFSSAPWLLPWSRAVFKSGYYLVRYFISEFFGFCHFNLSFSCLLFFCPATLFWFFWAGLFLALLFFLAWAVFFNVSGDTTVKLERRGRQCGGVIGALRSRASRFFCLQLHDRLMPFLSPQSEADFTCSSSRPEPSSHASPAAHDPQKFWVSFSPTQPRSPQPCPRRS